MFEVFCFFFQEIRTALQGCACTLEACVVKPRALRVNSLPNAEDLCSSTLKLHPGHVKCKIAFWPTAIQEGVCASIDRGVINAGSTVLETFNFVFWT